SRTPTSRRPLSGDPGQHVRDERLDETPRGRRWYTGEGVVERLIGGGGYTLPELIRELQAAVVHHQLEDSFGIDIRRAVVRGIRVPSGASQERDQRPSVAG